MAYAALVDVVYPVTGGLLAATAIATYCGGSPHRSPSRVALSASLGALGVSLVVQSPSARAVQDTVYVNLGQLTGNATTLVAAFATQLMVIHILYDRAEATSRARRSVVPLVAAVIAMTVLFFVTPTAASRFTSPTAPDGIIAYYVVFCGYLALTLTRVRRMVRRHLARSAYPAQRASLRLHTWACMMAVIYLAGRLATLVTGHLGISFDESLHFGMVEFVVAAAIPALGCVFTILAVVVGRWGPQLAAPVRWILNRRSYRRLAPLWEAAHAVRPEAVLPVPPGVGGAALRLYRRVIEIQDAQLAVARHLDHATRREIDAAIDDAGLSDDAAVATRDAATFALGLLTMREERPPASIVEAGVTDDRSDLRAVVGRLERASAAYVRSDLVRRLVAHHRFLDAGGSRSR